MKVLVFDTETTGLIKDYRASLYDTKLYPHVVQLSWLLFDTESHKLMNVGDHILKLPHDIKISDESAKIHGITTAIMKRRGVEPKHALQAFAKDLRQANVCVAHNIRFDKRMIRIEFIRNKMIDFMYKGNHKMCCTMTTSLDVCKIPRISKLQQTRIMLDECLKQLNMRDEIIKQSSVVNNHRDYLTPKKMGLTDMIDDLKSKEKVQYKMPKLIELHQYLFHSEPNNLHNSLVDVFVCFRCYYKLTYSTDIIEEYQELNTYYKKLCNM